MWIWGHFCNVNILQSGISLVGANSLVGAMFDCKLSSNGAVCDCQQATMVVEAPLVLCHDLSFTNFLIFATDSQIVPDESPPDSYLAAIQ